MSNLEIPKSPQKVRNKSFKFPAILLLGLSLPQISCSIITNPVVKKLFSQLPAQPQEKPEKLTLATYEDENGETKRLNERFSYYSKEAQRWLGLDENGLDENKALEGCGYQPFYLARILTKHSQLNIEEMKIIASKIREYAVYNIDDLAVSKQFEKNADLIK